MKLNRQKLKQVGVVFSLLILSNKDINSKELNDILNNVSETYCEINNPEYGDYLQKVYNELPEYLKIFLEKNSMHIIVMPNNDDLEKIYQDIYPRKDELKKITGLTIAEKLVALVEGCSHDENIQNYLYLKQGYSKEELYKFDLQHTMLHQIGHLVDIYYNYLSKTSSFLNGVYIKEQRDFSMQLCAFYNDNVDIRMNCVEFFATAFATYILNPKYLEKRFQLTYNYMNGVYNKIIDKTKNKSK